MTEATLKGAYLDEFRLALDCEIAHILDQKKLDDWQKQALVSFAAAKEFLRNKHESTLDAITQAAIDPKMRVHAEFCSLALPGQSPAQTAEKIVRAMSTPGGVPTADNVIGVATGILLTVRLSEAFSECHALQEQKGEQWVHDRINREDIPRIPDNALHYANKWLRATDELAELKASPGSLRLPLKQALCDGYHQGMVEALTHEKTCGKHEVDELVRKQIEQAMEMRRNFSAR